VSLAHKLVRGEGKGPLVAEEEGWGLLVVKDKEGATCGRGGPLVAEGDHLWQLYLVRPDHLRQGTTYGVTDHHQVSPLT